jgi:hypothetical protein
MSKKYKCTITETYTCSVEIPDDTNIGDFDISMVYNFDLPDDTEETFVEIRKDSLVDEVFMMDGSLYEHDFRRAFEKVHPELIKEK